MAKVSTMKKQQRAVPEWETITPDAASKILQKNDNNRNIVRNWVEFYKRQMLNHQWREDNGQTIVISKSGRLIDGQHRLTAIAESGVTLDMLVLRGVPEDYICTIDTGKPRSSADHLKVFGFGNDPNILAAAARIAMCFNPEGKYVQSWGKLSSTDIIDWVGSNKGISYSLKRIPVSINVLIPRSIAVAMHFILSLVDSTKSELFFDYVANGTNLGEGSPILALRSRLIARSHKSHSATERKKMISYIVSAFKAFHEGRKISEVKFNNDHDIIIEELSKQMSKKFWAWRGDMDEKKTAEKV